ncbi:MAG: DUF6503 family protein [Flavobacteriaceae bacterium]
MTRYLIILIALLFTLSTYSQQLTGQQLLEKAIQYHDPNGKWQRFNGTLEVTMTTPDKKQRVSTIKIDFPKHLFELTYTQDDAVITQKMEREECTLSLNGNSTISEEEILKYRLTCERAQMMKDYYTYLYGLPMKLNNPGTLISPKVERRTFKGKAYLVLKVTYEKEVGEDIWYFYFDPKTYAMEVYQFFHDEAKNDGEYILLSGETIVSDIKMPKTRAWYLNKDDKYLGTDVLTKS